MNKNRLRPSFKDRVYYNSIALTYGTGFKISKKVLLCLLVAFCIFTPFSNWLLIFKDRVTDIILRW